MGEQRRTLQYDRDSGEYYLYITVVKDDEELGETENETVLGVDLGVKTIAATSTGQFWSAGYFNHRRAEYERIRGKLQQTGTESAHRTIEEMGDREARWNDDYLHRISKALIHEAITYDCSTIVFEDLTDIRDRMPGAKAFHAWAFRRPYEYVEYKAAEHGIRAVQVDLAYTSQRCSYCGFTHPSNRTRQDHFCCQKCEYEVHADYNAVAGCHPAGNQKSSISGDGEGYRAKTCPGGPEAFVRTGHPSTGPEVGNAERERGVFPCNRLNGCQTGSSPTSSGGYVGVVDSVCKEMIDLRIGMVI